jgi:outer membrane receptor protein involved in Fe transport
VFYEKKSQEWFYRAYTPEFNNTLARFCWSNVCYYDFSGNTPVPGPGLPWWLSHDDVDWKQWAVFGDFTFDLTDQWTLSLGARYFDQESERVYVVDKEFLADPAFDSGGRAYPDRSPDEGKRKSDDADWVPKVSLTFKPRDGMLFYGLYSEGFRAGGVNRNRAATIFPEQYEPDTLKNYELGTKLLVADGRLQLNVTLFDMKWEDFQVEVLDPSFSDCPPDPIPPGLLCDGPFQVIVGNVGNAEVQGVEWSIRTRIGNGLDLGLDGTYLFKAETEDALDVTIPVPAGSTLPISAELKYAAYAQYNFPVQFIQGGEMYARVQYSFTDSSLNQLEPFPEAPPGNNDNSNTPQRTMDSYGIADVSAGLSTERWELQAFVDNVADERAELYWNTDDHQTYWGRNNLATNRPREYGLRFIYRWGD